jgi:signal peptidase I
MSGTIAITAIAALWFALLRPTALGGPASFVIVAGDSMLPTLRSGDLVVAQRHPDYPNGAVVVYRVPEDEPGAGASVIHRVVGGSLADGLLTRGDNTDGPDIWRPRAPDVLGQAWFSVPAVGRALAFVRSPLGLGAVTGFGVFVAALLWTPSRRRVAAA